MKTFKTRSNPSALSALALATLAVVHVGASAAASDDELKKTKVYGDVSIAEDSTSSWGPWSNFEPPAAGPATGSNEPVRRTVELYRPLAQPLSQPVVPPVVPPVEPIGLGCAGGSLCGFGVFSGNDSMNNSTTQVAPHAWMTTGKVIETDAGPLPLSIQLTTTALSAGASILMPDSGTLTRSVRSNDEGMSVTDVFYSANGAGYEAPFVVHGSSYNEFNSVAPATQVAVIDIYQYVRGPSSDDAPSSYQGRYGGGVLGFTTPDADMAALRADNATASYQGSMFGNGGGSVHVDVQFGAATWQASFNGGSDGKVGSYTMPGGTTVLYGNVGFNAAGTINGVNLQSTSVSTTDAGATVSGYVRGAFFGPQAAAIGGVVDITKTRPAVVVQPTNVAMPAAVAQTPVQQPAYTDAKFVAPFVAVNQSLVQPAAVPK